LEVPKAISLSIDEFHFIVETFRDSVIAREEPHGDDFLRPSRKSLAELHQWYQAGSSQPINGAQKARD
jgi:hypothetical protein